MKINRVKLLNVMGISELDIKLDGHWNEVLGDNGTGKTSFYEGLRSIGIKGNCAKLLRDGTEKGEVVYVLDDGSEIVKEISASKTNASMKHPEFGTIRQQNVIQGLVDALAINPIEFLTADRDKRVDLLLKSIPINLTADELSFIPTILLQSVDLEKHALLVIDQLYKAIYENRRDINRDADLKRKTATETKASLPADAPEGDWGTLHTDLADKMRELTGETSERVGKARRTAADQVTAIKDQHSKHKDAVNAELESKIENLRADAAIEIQRSEADRDAKIKTVETNRDEYIDNLKADYEPQHKELAEQIARASAMIEQHAKAETTRGYIGKLNDEAAGLEGKAKRLTEMLSSLEVLKSSKLEKLPISGLEVRDGDVFLGGLPFDSVNEARRIDLGIEVAMSRARAAKINLVCVDGLERFSPKTLAMFKKRAAKLAPDLQFVITRVTEGPLAISTDKEVA